MSGLSPISPNQAAGQTQTLPTWMQQGAQNQAFQGIGGLGAYNQYNPAAYGDLTSTLVSNPYAGQFQAGANLGGRLGTAGARDIFGGAQQLQQGAGAVLNTAFDPQQALYQRTLQNLLQESNAQMAGSGIGTTPYGAGLMNQNLQNFNTTWQAQQLQNQLAGLQGAGGAQNLAAGMYGQAPGLAYGAGAMPYQASTGMANTGLQALLQQLQYGQAGAQLPQQQITDYMQLLGLQPGLAGAQNQTALTQAQLQAQELKQLGAGLGVGANILFGGGQAGGILGGGALGQRGLMGLTGF